MNKLCSTCDWKGEALDTRKQVFIDGQWTDEGISRTWRLLCPDCGAILMEHQDTPKVQDATARTVNEALGALKEVVDKQGWQQ